MHPSVFTELLINLLTFLPFHWKLKLTSIRAIKNGVQRRHYVIFVGFGYKKSLGSSFFGAWADFHWNCERSLSSKLVLQSLISQTAFLPYVLDLWQNNGLSLQLWCLSNAFAFGFVHLTHQNSSANTQLLVYKYKLTSFNTKITCKNTPKRSEHLFKLKK